MSHFAVMVIGAEVEKQLAPFHEFECTGTNDEYVQDVDVTEEVQADIDEHGLEEGLGYSYDLEDRIVSDEADLDLNDVHTYGYAIVKDGKLVKAVKRTNPNKKWDWWVIGGRWSNRFLLKDGKRANQAAKGAIDFAGMRDEAGSKAAARWDKAAAGKVAAGLAETTTWDSWKTVRERNKDNIDAARTEYHEQPAKKAISEAFKDNFSLEVDQFLTPRDQYIQQARDGAAVFYAFVQDGQWVAKGEMGWFGMSDDQIKQGDWNRKVSELLDSLPDDTLISIVDCHI